MAPEYIGAVAGKYQWDDQPGGDADKDVQGEAITKYFWSERKNAASIFLELDGWDDVADDAFKVETDKTKCMSYHRLSRRHAANFQAHWLGARSSRREKKTWHKLLDDPSARNRKLTHCYNEGGSRG